MAEIQKTSTEIIIKFPKHSDLDIKFFNPETFEFLGFIDTSIHLETQNVSTMFGGADPTNKDKQLSFPFKYFSFMFKQLTPSTSKPTSIAPSSSESSSAPPPAPLPEPKKGLITNLSDSIANMVSKKQTSPSEKAVEESALQKATQEKAVEESPDQEATQEKAVEESPDQEATQEKAVEESPLQEATQEKAVEESPLQEATQEKAVEESPLQEATQEKAVEESPLQEATQEKAVEESPDQEATQEKAVEESPIEDSVSKEKALEESPIEDSLSKEKALEESPIEDSLSKEKALEESPIEDSLSKEKALEEKPKEESTAKAGMFSSFFGMFSRKPAVKEGEVSKIGSKEYELPEPTPTNETLYQSPEKTVVMGETYKTQPNFPLPFEPTSLVVPDKWIVHIPFSKNKERILSSESDYDNEYFEDVLLFSRMERKNGIYVRGDFYSVLGRKIKIGHVEELIPKEKHRTVREYLSNRPVLEGTLMQKYLEKFKING